MLWNHGLLDEKNRTFQGTVYEPLWSKANGQIAMTSTQKSLQRLWFISRKKMNTFFQWLLVLPLTKAKRKTWQKSCYLRKKISRQERSHSSTYFYRQDWKVARCCTTLKFQLKVKKLLAVFVFLCPSHNYPGHCAKDAQSWCTKSGRTELIIHTLNSMCLCKAIPTLSFWF